jgi:molecular chaperone DnaK (HSP70)
VERNPIDIVADVIRFVRSESLRSAQRQTLGQLGRAVVTIPVNMNGPRRAALREAFARTGISIAQFVHEPLAALYGHLRIRHIESLLDSVNMSPAQVSLRLVAGGMAAMPSVRSRLHELFVPEKVVVPSNSATLISQGAAWIAKDFQRLVLAKLLELEMARGSRLPLLHAGTEMPGDGEVRNVRTHLYCTDPSDGVVKLPIEAPTALSDHPQASDPRTNLGVVTVRVDERAPRSSRDSNSTSWSTTT